MKKTQTTSEAKQELGRAAELEFWVRRETCSHVSEPSLVLT